MSGVMASTTLAIRFLCEIAALVILGLWGWRAGGLVLAIGAPAAVALLWGLLIAPKARRRARDPLRFLLELVVFGAATGALFALGHPVPALLFAALALATAVLVRRWEPAQAP